MKYLIYVNSEFGQDIWNAPDETAKNCMLTSAKEFGFEVLKVEEFNN